MTKKLIVVSVVFLFLAIFSTVTFAKDFVLPEAGTTPDSSFYFLKSWKESIQTFFTFGAENKAKQYLHLAGVRLAEYRKMVEKEKLEIASKILAKYEKQLNRALDKINKVKEKGKDVKDLNEELQQTISRHLEVLQENFQKVPEAAKKGIENAIDNSSKILEKKEEQEEKKEQSPAGQYGGFAKCLKDKGVKMYGASWCSHCVNQKNMFGESLKYLNYVECAASGAPGPQEQVCQNAGIRAYPTWIFPDGKKNEGEMTFEQLSQDSGCKLD